PPPPPPRTVEEVVEEVVELADDVALDLRTTMAVVTPALPSTRGPRNGTAPMPGAPAPEAPVTSQEPA
ncbi:MAG TPA: hypothetical protein VFO65_08645, partial [Acidimicrobiales bacterium]|nr:hypothetical protein [Acidimicrobiales bacterium]